MKKAQRAIGQKGQSQKGGQSLVADKFGPASCFDWAVTYGTDWVCLSEASPAYPSAQNEMIEKDRPLSFIIVNENSGIYLRINCTPETGNFA